MSTSIESLSKGIAFISDETITFKPWILEIVLRGRTTLKDLKTERFTPLPAKIMPR